MYRNRQNENYFSQPTTNSASVHNSYYRLSENLNTRATVRSTPGRFQLPLSNVNDPTEPFSSFPRHSSTNNVATIDSNLETVRTLRERLLIDIRQNMREIDRELTSLGQLPRFTRRMPTRLSIMEPKIPLPYANDHMRIEKAKKVYAVMPRIPSETKPIANQLVLYSQRGRYHYGPEIEENVVDDNEGAIAKTEFTTASLLPANTYEILSTKDFVKIHSDLPTERVLIFVVQFEENTKLNPDDSIKDIPEQTPAKRYKLKSSFITLTDDFVAINQVTIQDFQTLIQTAPEFKPIESTTTTLVTEDAPSTVAVNEESANKNIEKPSQEESLPSNEQVHEEEPVIRKQSYFFSDFGNEGDGEEALVSFNSNHIDLPTESEILPESFLDKQPINTNETATKKTIILFSIESFFSSVPD